MTTGNQIIPITTEIANNAFSSPSDDSAPASCASCSPDFYTILGSEPLVLFVERSLRISAETKLDLSLNPTTIVSL